MISKFNHVSNVCNIYAFFLFFFFFFFFRVNNPLIRFRLYLLLYCTMFIKQKIPFRYDWKKVVTSVLEFMLSKEKEFGIDPKRIALMGISMGEYLVVRAVAFES